MPLGEMPGGIFVYKDLHKRPRKQKPRQMEQIETPKGCRLCFH